MTALPMLGLWALGTLVLLGLGTIPASEARPLNGPEQRIVRAVRSRVPAAMTLIERTVNQNSGTMNFAGIREVGRMLTPPLEALGFETRWIDGSAWGRAGHLVARRETRGARVKVLLIGHLDTVFEPDSPFQRFERIDDSTARGPGTCDMKGGDVVMLVALQALAEAGVLDRFAFRVVLSGDEENAGRPYEMSRRDLTEAARWADVAIGFEDGDGDPRTAVIARRGSSGWVLRTSGKPAHSSQIFRSDVGSGAVYEAGRILAAFHDSLSGETYLTANPGLVVGGTSIRHEREGSRGTAFGKNNVIAESTAVAGDLRALSLEQRERAKARMQRIAGRHLPHTDATLEFDDGYPPLALSEGNRRLLAIFDGASRDLGYGEVTADDPARAGAADVSFCDGLVDMALDGVGLMGQGGHTVEETADLRTLPMNAARVAVTLSRLLDSGRGVRGTEKRPSASRGAR